MTHANAPLTPEGHRRLALLITRDGWSLRRAAERYQRSPATAKRWVDRCRAGLPLTDHSSKPLTSPNQLPRRRAGPAGAHGYQEAGPNPGQWRLAYPRERVRAKPSCRRRTRTSGTRRRVTGPGGYRYMHHAVDDHSRVAYSEILDDERKETAAGFWTRANAFFASIGVTVTAVMTDNGACYRSHAFAHALGKNVKHEWTRPYRPQANGKVERFNRTLAAEWAYAKFYANEAERTAAYETWLHHYNHHRPHTGIGGRAAALGALSACSCR